MTCRFHRVSVRSEVIFTPIPRALAHADRTLVVRCRISFPKVVLDAPLKEKVKKKRLARINMPIDASQNYSVE